MRRIIDISPELERRIESLLAEKGFGDFHHFATVALENQIAWETGTDTKDVAPNYELNKLNGLNPAVAKVAIEDLLILSASKVSLLEPPSTANNILSGQHYRFLPVKIGVRV